VKTDIHEYSNIVVSVLFVLIMAAILLSTTCQAPRVVPDKESCMPPRDEAMRVYMTQCMENGNSRGECFWTYYDSYQLGLYDLEMPETLI